MRLIIPSTSEVEEFLDFLYEDLEGFVYSPVKDISVKSNEEGHWTQNFFKWPEQREELVEFVETTAKTLDIYLAPAIFKEPSSQKTSIKATNVVWVELDEKLPTGSEEIPAPNFKVQTSNENHQHWYWKLPQPLDNPDIIESFTRTLTFCIPGADSSGWDANQVLRIPGTFNFKRNTPVISLFQSPNRTDNSSFDTLPPPPPRTPDLDLSTIPDVTEVVLKYSWSKEASKLYLTPTPPVEQRSTYLVRLAYYCAEMGMVDGELFSILYNADERWGKFKDRRDRIQRLTEIITKVRIKYPIKSTNNNDETSLQIVGLQTLLRSRREIKWLIPGLLESKGSLLVTGPNGVGKTQFSLNTNIALALGTSTLKFTIAQQSKILFVSLEMGWEQLKSFLASMTQTLPANVLSTLEEQLLFLPLGESIALNDNEKHQLAIEEAIKEYKPNGLIIDSLGSAVRGDLSNHANVQPYLDWNDRIRNKYNLFTWVIHHHRKGTHNNKKPASLDDVYGDQYITGRASSVYCLWPTKKRDVIEAIPLKLRFSAPPPNWYIKRNSDLTMEVTNISSRNLIKETAPQEENKSSGSGLQM